MREIIGRIMVRPWVYRITCGVLFVAVMFVLRVALIALRDTGDRGLILSVCIPLGCGCIALAFWLERRGH